MENRKTLRRGVKGDLVEQLHKQLERYPVHLPKIELSQRRFGLGTERAVRIVQASFGLPNTGQVDSETADFLDIDAGDQQRKSLVEGVLTFEDGSPATDIDLRLVSAEEGNGRRRRRRLGAGTTDDSGTFSITYAGRWRGRVVQIYAVTKTGKRKKSKKEGRPKLIPLTDAWTANETLRIMNLVMPSEGSIRESEYIRIRTALEQYEQSVSEENGQSVEAKDSDREQPSPAPFEVDRSVISGFSQATGWDPRVSALAIHARSTGIDTGVMPDALYGAFRVGLPTDPKRLAALPTTTIFGAVKKAVEKSVITLTDEQITEVEEQIVIFKTDSEKSSKPGQSVSTREVVIAALPIGDEARKAFSETLDQGLTSTDFWRELARAGITEDEIATIRVRGQLGSLTSNSIELTDELAKITGKKGAHALVKKGLHRKEAWENLVKKLADQDPDKISALLPATLIGRSAEDRLNAFSETAAARVRIAFPSRVTAERVVSGDISVGDSAEEREAVATLLTAAEDHGYRIGTTPFAEFMRRNKEAVLKDVPEDLRDSAERNSEYLARLYQITPSDEAMSVLVAEGFSSARDIAEIKHTEFEALYGKKFDSTKTAQLVHRKATQVAAVTYNLFSGIQSVVTSDAPFAISGSEERLEESRQALTGRYATVSKIFGSLDYCECEHCQSIFSPAAYLVDLLHFIDTSESVWSNTMARWQDRYDGNEYPFKTEEDRLAFEQRFQEQFPGRPLPDREQTPFTVLSSRRPDLINLDLTCENTHTALPYIDVVNEILEHYVVHGKLSEETARNTANVDSADLIAEPQYTNESAYDKLKEARYPIGLPFTLPLARSRAIFEHFKTTLADVAESFRKNDDIDPPPASSEEYGHRAVALESIGVSKALSDLLSRANPLDEWFQLYGYDDEAEAIPALSQADTLAARLDLNYEVIQPILDSRFVSPQAKSTAILRRLGISVAEFYRFHRHPEWSPLTEDERSIIQKRLEELSAPAKNAFQELFDDGIFDNHIVLNAPAGVCDFSQTAVKRASGQPVDAWDLVRINLLTRIWKASEWDFDDLEPAVEIFYPRAHSPASPDTVGESLETVILCMGQLSRLNNVLPNKFALRHWLPIWSDIDSTGYWSLYEEIFLRSLPEAERKTWDSEVGEFPPTAGKTLAEIGQDISAAMTLSADELTSIVDSLGYDPEADAATMERLSAIYRVGFLAKAVGLTVDTLLGVIESSGIDPFQALPDTPLENAGEDKVRSATGVLLHAISVFRSSEIDLAFATYFASHLFDPEGPLALDIEATVSGLVDLAQQLRDVEENTLATPLDVQAVWQKLGTALGAEVGDRFESMFNGVIDYTAGEMLADVADRIGESNFEDESDIDVNFDAVTNQQTIVYRGVLSDDRRTALVALDPSPVLPRLLDDIRQQAVHFFEEHLERTGVGIGRSTGFLSRADYDKLFDGTIVPDQRLEFLWQSVSPYVIERGIRTAAIRYIGSLTDWSDELSSRTATDDSIISGPAGESVAEMLSETRSHGFTATYFDDTGAELNRETVPSISLDRAPAGTERVRFETYFRPTRTGPYRFYIGSETDGVTCRAQVDEAPPFLEFVTGAGGEEKSAFVMLEASGAHRLTLSFQNVGGAPLREGVLSLGEGRTSISALNVIPSAPVEQSVAVSLRFIKLSKLAGEMSLTDGEVEFALTTPSALGPTAISETPIGDSDAAGVQVGLFESLKSLAMYVILKREMAGNGDGLLQIMRSVRRVDSADSDADVAISTLAEDLTERIALLTRRRYDSVDSVRQHFGLSAESTVDDGARVTVAPRFSEPRTIHKLWESLKVIQKVGGDANAVIDAASPTPTGETVSAIRSAVRQSFDLVTWRRIAPSIFDKIRAKKRDALVGYISHQLRLPDPDELHNYFLIDPLTEPVVHTSRIQLAIASVQSFVQRSLLNLEDEVDPSVIDSDVFAWSKRYRVWEAARKIASYPQNWLEPDFRDDKTHLYRAFESELFENDVSSDSAEKAFFRYLRELSGIAKLEIVSLHVEENDDPGRTALHILGRTATQPHKYFISKYQFGQWDPWTPVDAEIEGDHIALTKWRGRLQIFWVTFLDKGTDGANAPPTSTVSAVSMTLGDIGSTVGGSVRRKKVTAQLSWAELANGEWEPRHSSGFRDDFTAIVDRDTDLGAIPINVVTETGEERDGPLQIHLGYPFRVSFRVVSRLVPPRRMAFLWMGPIPYSSSGQKASLNIGPSSDDLEVALLTRLEDGPTMERPSFESGRVKILEKGLPFTLCVANNAPRMMNEVGNFSDAFEDFFAEMYGVEIPDRAIPPDFWEAIAEVGAYFAALQATPFFLQNDHHVFYVEPTVHERTITDWGFDGWRDYMPWANTFANEWLERVPVESIGPRLTIPTDAIEEADVVADEGIYRRRETTDWLVNARTLLSINNQLFTQAPTASRGVAEVIERENVVDGVGLRQEVLSATLAERRSREKDLRGSIIR